jgi:3-oxoacyl-[acyl-carrier-protein] synthase-3
MKDEDLPDYILLVIPDTTTRHVDYRDRTTAILWGDCSTAIIVSKKIKSNFLVDQVTLATDPKSWDKIILPAGGYFSQQGHAVHKFGIVKMLNMTMELIEHSHLLPDQFYFIGHQANLRMLQATCKKMQIPAEKHLYNIDHFGNCGGAGAPSVLSENYEHFKSGDVILIALVGAGLTWGSVLIRAI